MENRKRLQRRPAGWIGSCRLADDPSDVWRSCRVVDISMLGVRITFDYPNPDHLLDRHISVNLPGDASAVNVRLDGAITSVMPSIDRGFRVGIEFDPLTEMEQAITAVLSVMTDVLVETG